MYQEDAMKTREVMTAEVIAVRPDDSVLDAGRLMLEKKVSGVLVMDGGTLVGVITQGDLLRRSEVGTVKRRSRWMEFLVGSGALAQEYVNASARRVDEVMTREVLTVSEDAELAAAVEIMESNDIKRVPVTLGKAVIGMITRTDLVRAFVNAAGKTESPLDDDGIWQRLFEELKKERWSPGAIDISVKNGVVTLRGAVLDERQISAVAVMAENIPGVTAINNELVWIEPVSGLVVPGPDQVGKQV
jgi:CBS domain-containing protein